MKKVYSCIARSVLMLFAVCFGWSSMAQSVIQIGSGTLSPATTLYSPVYRFSATSTTTDCRSNIIYTAAELTAAGINTGDIITALAFNKLTGDNFITPATYTIYMGNTNNTVPLTGTIATQWTNIMASHVQVYTSNAFNMPASAGWMTITLNTPFTYTGGSLEIATDLLMGGNGAATGAFKFEYTSGFADRIIGATSGNSNLATYKQRPNIRFTVQIGQPCTNPPVGGTATASLTNICLNTQVDLNLTGNGIGSGLTYTWQSSNDNITYTDITTPALVTNTTVTPTATTWYRCKLICNNQTPTFSSPVLVSVIVPQINVNTTTASLCGPGTATFTATANDPNVAIKWYDDALLTNLLHTGNSFSTPFVGSNKNFYVVGELINVGCLSQVEVLTVDVNGTPEVDLGDNYEKCVDPDNYEFLNARNPGANYLWDNGYNGQVRTVNTSGTYWVRVTGPNGCVSADTISINLKLNPSVKLGNDTVLCIGAKLNLDAGAGGISYIWNNGSVQQNILTNGLDEYHVLVVGDNGCVGTDTIKLDYSGRFPTHEGIWVRSLGANTFNFSVLNPSSITSYEWDFGDGSLLNRSSTPNHTFPNNGNYVVRLITNSSCGSMLDTTTVHIYGLSLDNALYNKVEIYPNPAQTTLHIKGNAIELQEVVLSNISGQVLIKKAVKGNEDVQLDLSNYQNGMYLVTIITADGSVTKPVSVLK